MQADITVVGVGCGWGASNMGTAKGPGYLFASHDPEQDTPSSFSDLFSPHVVYDTFHDSLSDLDSFYPLDGDALRHRTEGVLKMLLTEYETLYTIFKKSSKPFVIGGDHSIAIATWSAAAAYKHHPFGLIWIDAHLDAHTPQTSPSHAIHGMPVAVLLGYGDDRFTSIGFKGAKLHPENIAYIAVRSFEKEELDLLKGLGVKIFFMENVTEQGFQKIFHQAREHVCRNTPFFGVSFDIDAVDPIDAPGTGTRASTPHGLQAKDVISALQGLLFDPHLIGFELMEYNPDLDKNDLTLKLIWRLTHSLYRRP